MYKWIQLAEKPLGHSDYTNLATQIWRSNHSSPYFGQNQTEKNGHWASRLTYFSSEFY
jgi:hypothetical protein